ncbi:hypothetical protein FRC12_010440 [Ceratobasidium sp. 428]|nr:hypothetical protein FRC12_010440 [Ceratobasidium sp. 428]
MELAAAEDNGAGTGTGDLDKTASNSNTLSDNKCAMDLETHLNGELDDGNEDMELDNDATNGNFPDISNATISNFDVEYHLSGAPSLLCSWLNLRTPSPPPPSSLFQLSDNNLSEGEDDSISITVVYDRKYDR